MPSGLSSLGHGIATLVQHGPSGYKLSCKSNAPGRPAHLPDDTELRVRASEKPRRALPLTNASKPFLNVYITLLVRNLKIP